MHIVRFRDIFFCLLMLILAACTEESKIPGNNSGVKALFSGSLSNILTKTPIENGEEIPIGTKVGIFALSYSGADESSVVWPALQGNYQVFNLEGTTAAGAPQTISTATEYFYPAGQKIAFYSYYPRTVTPTFNSGSAPSIEVNIPSVPTSQTDYLWATPVTGMSLSPEINFVYNHALSLIRIKVQKSTSDVLAIKSVKISTAQKQKGLMNIATGTMISTDLAGGATEFALSGLNLDIPLQGTGGAPLQLNDGKFLFIPGTTITAIKLFIRVSGEFIDREYTISSPSLTLNKGAALHVVLSVSKKEAVISNWNDLDDTGTIGEAPPGPANCHIMVPGATRIIPVGIKGNGSASAIEGGISVTHTAASMGILWTTTAGLVTLSDFNSTDQKVKITASAGTGNALIAAYSGAGQTGTILWSWHIWVTNYNPDTPSNGTTYTFTNSSGATNTFMDRDLGSLSTTSVVNTDQNVLYYQFGRKDPFPGGNYSLPATLAGKQTMNIAIQNPTKFITFSTGNWCSTASDVWWMGIGGTSTTPGAKTIYDPCPSGWRVPVYKNAASPWAGLNATNSTWTSGCRVWTTPYNAGSWALVGYRNRSNSIITDVSSSGFFWTSLSFDGNNSMVGYVTNVSFSLSGFDRASGVVVRCVRE